MREPLFTYRLLLLGVKHTTIQVDSVSLLWIIFYYGLPKLLGYKAYQNCHLNAHQELLNKTHMYAPWTELSPAKCVNYIKGKICSKITV